MMGLTAEESGFDSRQWKEIIPFSAASRLTPGLTQPLIQYVHGGSFPRGSSQGLKFTIHLRLLQKLKSTWIHTASPLYNYMARCPVKHRDNFILSSTVFIFICSKFSHFLYYLLCFSLSYI